MVVEVELKHHRHVPFCFHLPPEGHWFLPRATPHWADVSVVMGLLLFTLGTWSFYSGLSTCSYLRIKPVPISDGYIAVPGYSAAVCCSIFFQHGRHVCPQMCAKYTHACMFPIFFLDFGIDCVHLHRDHHGVLPVWRPLLFWVCKL
jgi:hypothetical protein